MPLPTTPVTRRRIVAAACLAACLALPLGSRAAGADSRSALPPLPSQQGAASVQLWHAGARDAIARHKPNQQAALRWLAYLAWAQHQAAEALAGDLPGASEAAWSALFDRVSSETLAGLVPADAADWRRLAGDLALTRRAGAADVARAEALADQAARATLSRAATDGFDAAAAAAPPVAADAWRSQLQPPRPPHLPLLGTMKTMYLRGGDAVRPPPPPAIDSAAFRQALAEVRERAGRGDAEGLARARRWEMTSGSLVAGFWDEMALGLAARHGQGGRATSRTLALALGATLDANIACHDAKYAYWLPRPSQADAAIRPLIALPNHPSYPSNHSCDSGAAAEVLATLFDGEARTLRAMAVEAGESRIDGGIHYRFDLDAGLAIGRAAARAALASAPVAEARPGSRP